MNELPLTEGHVLEDIRLLGNWLRAPAENTPAEWDNILDGRDNIAIYIRAGRRLRDQDQARLAAIDRTLEAFAPTILDAMALTRRNLPDDHWALDFRRRHENHR